MPERSPLPPRLSRGHFVGLLFATVLSIGALIGAADADRRSIGVAIVPFGWQRLIVIHSLATLMLSWWLARILQRCQPKWQRRTSCWVYGAVGVAMAALTFFFGSHPAIVLEGSEPSYAWRMLARILWCAALQTPWCVVGFELSRADGASRPPLFSSANLFALAAITALGVPLSFLSVFLNQQAAVARDAWSRWKLADARVLVQRLKDVGCSTSLGERPTARDRGGVTTQITPARALADLQAACQIVKRQIDAMMAKPVRDEERRKLAQCYLALNRHDQAETILRPLADRDALVALDLARLLRERDRPEESRTWAATALRQSRAERHTPESDPIDWDAVSMGAYDLLAMLAGDAADFAAAEGVWQEALKVLPMHRAHIHSQLAKHFEFTGELSRSRAHEAQAALAAPQEYSPPASLISKMLSTGAPIGLARPKSSQYK